MLRTPLRFLISSLAFGLAFVVNPAYLSGCAPGQENGLSKQELAQIEADLIQDMEVVNALGGWRFTYGGEDYEVLLALTQEEGEDDSARAPGARFTSTAYACGNHTFFQSASACATTYMLAVEGTLTLRRLGADATTIVEDLPVTGTVASIGGVGGYGGVGLSFGENSTLNLGFDNALETFEAQGLGEAMLDISYSAY